LVQVFRSHVKNAVKSGVTRTDRYSTEWEQTPSHPFQDRCLKSGRIVAVLDQIEAEQREPTLPKDIDALRLLQMVYRGEFKASPQQMRAAIEALPFENPKLASVAVGHLTAEDFYSRLDRAVERSERARLIDGMAIEVEDHE